IRDFHVTGVQTWLFRSLISFIGTVSMKTSIHLHQTHHTVADFDAIFKSTTEYLTQEGLHLFPELYLTGYPLQDLVLQRPFIDARSEERRVGKVRSCRCW